MLFACSLMMIFPFFAPCFSLVALLVNYKDGQIKNEQETRGLVNVYFARISTEKKLHWASEHEQGRQEPERKNEKGNTVLGNFEAHWVIIRSQHSLLWVFSTPPDKSIQTSSIPKCMRKIETNRSILVNSRKKEYPMKKKIWFETQNHSKGLTFSGTFSIFQRVSFIRMISLYFSGPILSIRKKSIGEI